MQNEEFLQKIIDQVGYAYGRWQDEQEYEDFAEYEQFFKDISTPHGMEVLKGYKRPFGFKFRHQGSLVEYRLTVAKSGKNHVNVTIKGV